MRTRAAMLRGMAAAKWDAEKPVVIGLVAGLIVGPIISGATGFQVWTSTARAAARAGVAEQQALFCAERARTANPDAVALGYQARSGLAQLRAAMPGASRTDPNRSSPAPASCWASARWTD